VFVDPQLNAMLVVHEDSHLVDALLTGQFGKVPLVVAVLPQQVFPAQSSGPSHAIALPDGQDAAQLRVMGAVSDDGQHT
jgi:hypothetical protein